VLWLAVADMNETLELVTRYGGQILEPPAPDGPARTPARTLATIADPEGNPIGLVGHAPPP
jgi:predicted enzyme related to lactoylglutathione lyase